MGKEPSSWKAQHTYIALAAVCGFLWFFVIHFGRRQFGAFDFNIPIEMGWKQILGERPYVDFPATTPPGFNLGCKYAFKLFGVRWDANLYWAAIFTCTTFVWMYWLMRRLRVGGLPSASTAFAIECAAMLSTCVWYYNDSALVLAAVFFLCCLSYTREPQHAGVQVSYVLALALLSLMKPNIAGLTIVGCVFLLFVVTKQKKKLLLLTLAASVMAVGFLAWNGVPIDKMVASYASVARQHGGLHSQYEYRMLPGPEQNWVTCWYTLLSIPLLGLVPTWVRHIRQREWRHAVIPLFFVLSLFIAIYGVLTNGEFRDAECTVLIAADSLIVFDLRWNEPSIRRLYIALLCASIFGDLYYGAMRLRVYTIGPGVFFEWNDNDHRIPSGFLKNMVVSGPMARVEGEIGQALMSNPGPYFFGPRVDFNYAVFGIKSPQGFPAWWHPGTAFPRSQEPEILQGWEQQRFSTLIFLKPGFAGHGKGMYFTYYSPEFLGMIAREYSPDTSYPDILIYRRR